MPVHNEFVLRSNSASFPVVMLSIMAYDFTGIDNGYINMSSDSNNPSLPHSSAYVSSAKSCDATDTEKTLRALIDAAPICIHEISLEGLLTAMNPAGLKMMGVKSQDEIRGLRYLDVIIDEDKDRVSTLMDKAIQGESSKFEFRVMGDSKLLYYSSSFQPLTDDHGNVNRLMGVTTDITEMKENQNKLEHLAHHDSLTGLPNRTLILDRLEKNIDEAKRGKQLVATIFLDLDDFKKVNDTIGHKAGDAILVLASQRLKNLLRAEDTVGRFGGDEFVIILSNIAELSDAQNIVYKILSSFQQAFEVDSHEFVITASIGVSIYPYDGNNSDELLQKADMAMYHAKAGGRNEHHFFNDSMSLAVARRLEIEERLRGALERGELYVVFQPIISVKNRNISGAEALLRWQSPDLGSVLPEEFIPIAEKTGLIIAIGNFVLSQAIQLAASIHSQGKDNFKIAVNLSPRQFRDPHLVNFIQVQLKDLSLNPNFLELEITEGVLLEKYTHVNEVLKSLRKLGVRISVDDFGTGYSSLSYLCKYSFDTIKIDRSFVKDMEMQNDYATLVDAMLAIAQGLHLGIIAEGVETESQHKYLKDQGCSHAQGYLYSRPATAEHLFDLMGMRQLQSKTVLLEGRMGAA